MRRRLEGILAATVLAAGALWLNAVTLPTLVFACSCALPQSLAEAAADRRQAIIVGTIGFAVGNATAVAVESAFGPHPPPAVELLVGGIGSESSACQLDASAGERWLLVLYRADNGGYSTSNCSLSARLGTDVGDELLTHAIEAFGESRVEPTHEPAPTAPGPRDSAPWLGGIGWVAVVLAAGAAVLVGAVLVAGRRPPT